MPKRTKGSTRASGKTPCSPISRLLRESSQPARSHRRMAYSAPSTCRQIKYTSTTDRGQKESSERSVAGWCSTPKGGALSARPLCSASGSAAVLKVGRRPAAGGRTSALRGSGSPRRRCSSSSAATATVAVVASDAARFGSGSAVVDASEADLEEGVDRAEADSSSADLSGAGGGPATESDAVADGVSLPASRLRVCNVDSFSVGSSRADNLLSSVAFP